MPRWRNAPYVDGTRRATARPRVAARACRAPAMLEALLRVAALRLVDAAVELGGCRVLRGGAHTQGFLSVNLRTSCRATL